MKVPGLRSLAANKPACPFAGWEGVDMGVIFTSGHGPFGLFGGGGLASSEGVRRAERWSDFIAGEYTGVSR